MKRLAIYICCSLLIALIPCVIGLYWLLDSPAGARFALTTLAGMSGQAISIRDADGTLLGHLHLAGVRVTRPKLQLQIDSLDLAWDPRQLLHGNLLVRELTLAGVRIQDDAAPSTVPPQLNWPRVSGVARRLNAQISRVQVKELSYRSLDAPPLIVTEFSSSLAYNDGLLSLSKLHLVSPDGQLSGELAAGFSDLQLRLDLEMAPTLPIQGMDHFSLQARLLPGRDLEQLSGGIAAVGTSRGEQHLKLDAELGMTGNTFNMRRLLIVRPGERGSLAGEGSMKLTTTEPVIVLKLKAVDLDLERELDQPTRLTGTVDFSGSLSSFQGKFSLKNSGAGWQSAAMAADYEGGFAGLKLTSISGALLEGSVAGDLAITWNKGVQISGTLAGRGLNPGPVAPDWPGLVNLDLAGNLDVPNKGELHGELRGKLLKSHLHGQDLQGELLAAFTGQRLRIDHLFLNGNGFKVKGAGELDRRLNLTATVSDLSTLVAGGAGELQADGWLRWRDGLLSGSASGQGSKLAVSGMQAATVQFNTGFGEGDGFPVQLDASLDQLQFGNVVVEKALLALQGTAARHTVSLALRSPGSEAQALLSGGYGNGIWRGELTKLSGRDSVGPWNLAAPAPLVLSADRLLLNPLIINGFPDERIEIAGELTRHPLNGTLTGAWNHVNLARADRWLDGVELTGDSSGTLDLHTLPGEKLFLAARAAAHGTVSADGKRVNLEKVSATIEGDGRVLNASLDLALENGAGEAHLFFKSPHPAALKLPGQGDLMLRCSDFDLALLRPFLASNIAVDGRLTGVVYGKLRPGVRLDLDGNAALDKGHVVWHGEGQEFDASLDTAEVGFSWGGGRAGAGKVGAGLLKLTGLAAATGAYTTNGHRIALAQSTFRFDADQHNMRAGLDLAIDGGGTLKGDFSSATPVGPSIPETGDLVLEWGGIDSVLLNSWLPGTLNLQGLLGGKATGKLLQGQRLEMAGETVFSQGKVKLQGDSGEVNAKLRSTSLSFVWRGETLTGALSLALAEYGEAKGSFLLPIPARFPVVINQKGILRGALSGKVQERGFFTAFLPGLVQDSHGELDLDLKLGGIWSEPRLTGTLNLSKGGAYLTSAGIRVSDGQLSALLEGDQIRIDSFRAVSGAGHIEGDALLQLKGWQVAGYSGTLKGERFQTIDLPELQLSSSPQLSFEGQGDSVTLHGELLIPEMLVVGSQGRPIVTPSRDIIMEGVPEASVGKKTTLSLGGRIHLQLGEKVHVKTSGIDAQLGGEMDLVLKGVDKISSSGEIHVVKGRYRAYGVNLDIVRGRLYYADGPVDQPNLDILALSTVGDVRAGVIVAGTLNEPVVKLYSEPPMPEVDIMSYMVLGHPLGSSSEQGNMLAMAANSLFTYGEADSLQEQIKGRLGLSSLGLETVDTSGAGLMGYKEMSGTPAGMAPTNSAAGQTVFTVGKYLTPKLYLSYGRAMVTGGNLFLLRYDVLKHWQIETQSGSESGADLYYKLEFD